MQKIASIFIVIIFTLVMACTGVLRPDERRTAAELLITQHGWHGDQIAAQDMQLFLCYRNTQPGKTLRVYIEGDGFAYITAYQASADPTPLKPVLLSLALSDPSPNIVYLARPCQYLLAQNPVCSSADWTTGRFSALQVKRMNAALDNLKVKFSPASFELVGYSGGAALAADLAAKRSDVSALITVAGNLDISGFVAYHQLSPLEDVVEPLSFKDILRNIPQKHLVSNDDTVVPPVLVQEYLNTLAGANAHIKIVDGPSHGDGWEKYWQDFVR